DCVLGTYCGGLAGLACGACESWHSVGQPCVPGGCDPATSACPLFLLDGGQRTCVPLSDAGQPCVFPTDCRGYPAAWCVIPSDGGARLCGPVPLGSPCEGMLDCAPIGFCDGASPGIAGTCRARIPSGGACTPQAMDDGCINGNCLDGVCVT